MIWGFLAILWEYIATKILKPKPFRLWNRVLYDSQSRKRAQTVSTLESWFTRLPNSKAGSNRFDFGIVIYTNPKVESGPQTVSTLESWFARIPKSKAGPNRFDFGIVIYTSPKVESGPKPFRLWNRDLHESQGRKRAQTVSTLESWFTRIPKPKAGPHRFHTDEVWPNCRLVGDVVDTKLKEVSHEDKISLLRLCFLAVDEIDTTLRKVSHEDKHVVKSKIHGHKKKRCNHRSINKERTGLRATMLTTEPHMVCVTTHGASGGTDGHHWSLSQWGKCGLLPRSIKLQPMSTSADVKLLFDPTATVSTPYFL